MNDPLTPRETEIVMLLLSGVTHREEMARCMNLSVKTIHTHLYNIFEKTGAYGMADLILWAIRNGYQVEP